MRKMMNKKGFSLVELMIVVVIMGILIAVAVPLYGAITANSKNKTCATNIDNIQANARNWFLSKNEVANEAAIKSMFDNGQLPDCPWETGEGADDDHDDYTIKFYNDGTVEIDCACEPTDEKDKADHEKGFVDAKAGASLVDANTITAGAVKGVS